MNHLAGSGADPFAPTNSSLHVKIQSDLVAVECFSVLCCVALPKHARKTSRAISGRGLACFRRGLTKTCPLNKSIWKIMSETKDCPEKLTQGCRLDESHAFGMFEYHFLGTQLRVLKVAKSSQFATIFAKASSSLLVIASGENFIECVARAAAPSFVLKSGCSSKRRRFCASSSGSFGGASNPFTPCSISSGIPP